MFKHIKLRISFAFGIPALIFIACFLISHTSKFREHSDKISIAILLDLLVVAPLAYFLMIRKSAKSKFTVLRVFMAGVIFSSFLLSGINSQVIGIVKIWIAPLAEIVLTVFIVWKFYIANEIANSVTIIEKDFLTHCRNVLKFVFGNEKIANVVSSEISVFYYLFKGADKTIDYKTRFTTYKENGIVLVLFLVLFIFLVETVSMHFLLLMWNKTAAWILTSLSIYTCLQLIAHIRALKSRSIVIKNANILLRNGLLGGEVMIQLNNISKIELTNKSVQRADVVKISLLKSLENHNLAIHLHQPVIVMKAFGLKKNAMVILVYIDESKLFIESLESI